MSRNAAAKHHKAGDGDADQVRQKKQKRSLRDLVGETRHRSTAKHTATISEPSVRPMPLTQSGGTRATAIATPAIEFDNCLRVIENDPAMAAATAMPRSIRWETCGR